MKKILSLLIIIAILFSAFGSMSASNQPLDVQMKSVHLKNSSVCMQENNDYASISLANSSLMYQPGKPILPFISKTIILPFGSDVVDVDVHYQKDIVTLSKKIQICPTIAVNLPMQHNENTPCFITQSISQSDQCYPDTAVSYHQGSGLYQKNHVLFLTVDIAIQHNPLENTLIIPKDVTIDISYKPPSQQLFSNDDFDLLIISDESFSTNIEPFIEYKNQQGIRTLLQTTEEIYDNYNGRDPAEQIKYFIKDAIEQYGIKDVLLIGDTNHVPMRKCDTTVLTGVIDWYEIRSDLYYADVYDSNGDFSSWDSNNNQKYSECSYDYRYAIIASEIIDTVDLYPDVGVGRIPCSNQKDCQTVIEKIMNYDRAKEQGDWYHKMIVMGGDTTPNSYATFEGEWLQETHIVPYMESCGFELVKLYTSLGTFQPDVITSEISSGACFVNYAGHGYMDHIGTYLPQSSTSIDYTMEDVQAMTNEEKLPVFFLDACLTGKIDYDIFDKIMVPICFMYPFPLVHFFKRCVDTIETTHFYPCFAGSLLFKENGGGIAVIAASQPGLSGIALDDGEIIDIVFGSSNLNRFFFQSYQPNSTVSELMIDAQNTYINTIRGPNSFIIDYVTLQEFNVFGDPSLIIGG